MPLLEDRPLIRPLSPLLEDTRRHITGAQYSPPVRCDIATSVKAPAPAILPYPCPCPCNSVMPLPWYTLLCYAMIRPAICSDSCLFAHGRIYTLAGPARARPRRSTFTQHSHHPIHSPSPQHRFLYVFELILRTISPDPQLKLNEHSVIEVSN